MKHHIFINQVLVFFFLFLHSLLFSNEREVILSEAKRFHPNIEMKFSKLPLEAKLSDDLKPWANSFWPHIYSGILFQWKKHYNTIPPFADLHVQIENTKNEILEKKSHLFDSDLSTFQRQSLISEISSLRSRQRSLEINIGRMYDDFFFQRSFLDSLQDALRLSQNELDELSPAEKYDLYVSDREGRSKFRLTKEIQKGTQPFDAYWEGICHGWSSVSLEFQEPQIYDHRLSNGKRLRFYSSDLKALLSQYHAAITKNWRAQKTNGTRRVGERCNTAFPEESWFKEGGQEYFYSVLNGQVQKNLVPPECVDMNPASFHVIIANMIGRHQKGFVAEAVRDKEIWNQPVFAYNAKIIETKNRRAYQTFGTQLSHLIELEMIYANDGGRMFWLEDRGGYDEFFAWEGPTNHTPLYRSASKIFKYWIDLDRNGHVIGGEWESYLRPDFVWLKKSRGFLPQRSFYGIVNHMNDLQNLVELHQ